MKRVLAGIVIALFVSTVVSAESSVWKAEKDGSVIYVGATCHLLRDTDYPLPPEFAEAYEQSAILVFETDIGKLNSPAAQQDLMAHATYEDGSTLDEHLSAEAYAKLEEFCASNGIPLQSFQQVKPSLVVMTLTVLELMKLGVTQEGVDQFFYGQATEGGKPIEGLETVEEQIGHLVSMADGFEDEFVIYSIDDMKSIEQQFEALVAAWRSGDTEKLHDLMVAELETRFPKLYEKLITERNENWLPALEAYGRTPETEFVLVGAGHLVGPEGIIEVLREKGYTVEKL